MGRAKRKHQQRGSLAQPQQIPSLSPSDRFVTVRATMGYSQHIYAPERSSLTLCDLTAAEEMDEGIDFEAYERSCHGQHIAPKYYCAPCNRRYLRIPGIEEDRWSNWKLRVNIQVPTDYRNRH